MAVIALVAENADRAGFCHQRRQFVEFFPGLRRLQMFGVNLVQHVEPAAACGLAALFRGAKPTQMQIGNAARIEPGPELVLRETGPARGRDRADVNQQLDAGVLQLVEHGLGGRLFIPDGEELFGFGHGLPDHLTRAINSMAPAGARTLPSWIT